MKDNAFQLKNACLKQHVKHAKAYDKNGRSFAVCHLDYLAQNTVVQHRLGCTTFILTKRGKVQF
jgi:hypothetical protein